MSARLLTTTTLSVGRNLRQTRRAADANGRDHRPLGEIDDRNIGRAGVGHVSALAVGRNRDEVGRAMNADGRHDFVALRVDDADVVGVGVGDVDFVARGTGGDTGRTRAHGNRLDVAKLQQIEDADRVALAVGDVGVFVVAGLNGLGVDGRRSALSESGNTPAARRHVQRLSCCASASGGRSSGRVAAATLPGWRQARRRSVQARWQSGAPRP